MPDEHVSSSSDAQRTLIRAPEVDLYIDKFLDTVCDKKRRAIVELLAISALEEGAQNVEMRSGDIARTIGLSPATTSEHLRQLTLAGLLLSRREGNTVYYRLCNHKLVTAFRNLIEALDDDYRFQQKS